MTLFITLTTAQADAGPFNIFSNVDYTSAIAVNVSKADLLAGFPINNAPAGTTSVRIKSIGACTNSTDISVTGTTALEIVETSTTSTTTITTTNPIMPKTRL
jgi:hypothetical protein